MGRPLSLHRPSFDFGAMSVLTSSSLRQVWDPSLEPNQNSVIQPRLAQACKLPRTEIQSLTSLMQTMLVPDKV